MGYFVDLVAGPTGPGTCDELISRAHLEGAYLLSKGKRGLDHLGFGQIYFLADEDITDERVGHIRIPTSAGKEQWLAMIDFAQRIGCRIYDEVVEDFVTAENIPAEFLLTNAEREAAYLEYVFRGNPPDAKRLVEIAEESTFRGYCRRCRSYFRISESDSKRLVERWVPDTPPEQPRDRSSDIVEPLFMMVSRCPSCSSLFADRHDEVGAWLISLETMEIVFG